MKTSRRYQILPDRALCYQPGCTFHRDGPAAETLGEAHATMTGHQVRVMSSAVAIFNSHGGPDTPEVQATRRAVLQREAS